MHMQMADIEGRWTHIDKFLLRGSPLAPASFTPCKELKDFILTSTKVLLIGAGGLGCELLKDLAFMGFLNIDVIDMDVIDLSNLNRQFLFRQADVGKYKAEVAASFINKRVPGANVQAHTCAIQDKPTEFYKQFTLVVCGLDNLEARRWINALLVSLVEVDEKGDPVPGADIKPMVDGGTEAFKGQTMVIIPRMTACFECRMNLFPPPTKFPACTLKSNPRIAEHCIIYVKEKIWGQLRPGEALDKDDPAHVNWIVEKSIERANEYKVPTQKITFQFTQGVIKNTIPAIASTNALVSAGCAMEVFKVATSCADNLSDHSLFSGDIGAQVRAWKNERNPNCPVCSGAKAKLDIEPSLLLEEFLEQLQGEPFQLGRVSIRAPGAGKNGKTKSVFFPKGPLAASTAPNLKKAMSDLVPSGCELVVNAVDMQATWEITVNF